MFSEPVYVNGDIDVSYIAKYIYGKSVITPRKLLAV